MSSQDSEEAGSYTEAVGTRLSPQTKRQFDHYKEENEIGNSEALRRLLRDALDDNTAEQRRFARNAAAVFGIIYIVIWFFGDRTTLQPIFGVFVVVMLWWSLAPDLQEWRDS